MGSISIPTEQRTSRRRKITAVLAGGLVLGVGAAVTLAAWNDSEFATGNFAAGSFNLLGSDDGVSFSDHATEGEAQSLTFAVGADNLSPDDDVYALYSLRAEGNPAVITPASPTFTGEVDAAKLTVVAHEIEGTECDATTFDESSTDRTSGAFTLAEDTNVNLCLQVTATGALEQNDAGSILWQWDAVSQ